MIAILVSIALVWIALGLTCALRVGCRRRTGESQVAADPFFFPFGEMPGFSDAQLRAMCQAPHPRDPLRRSFSRDYFNDPAGLALRTDAGSDGPSFPSGPAAARKPFIDAGIEPRKILSWIEMRELRRKWDSFHG